MRRYVFIGIVVLLVGLCVGVFFGTQSLGSNSHGDSGEQVRTQAAHPGYFGYAMMSLLVGGAAVLLIRPRRRVVSADRHE